MEKPCVKKKRENHYVYFHTFRCNSLTMTLLKILELKTIPQWYICSSHGKMCYTRRSNNCAKHTTVRLLATALFKRNLKTNSNPVFTRHVILLFKR